MSYTTELTEDCMGIVHVGGGLVTGADLLEACRSATQLIQNTENFHYEFIDFTEARELRISPEELEQIVAQDHFAATFRPEAVVVVIAPDEEIFQTAKKWERRVQDLGWQTHIARTRAEGLSWLREHYPSPAKAFAGTSGTEAESSQN